MSHTPPTNLTPPKTDSRSASPAGNDKPRLVSGSLKDRIAKFNNPSAAPLVPTHAFGTAGPTGSSSNARGGLIGNRIPSVGARDAAMPAGQRRVSEHKGMIGNRLPTIGARSVGLVPGRSASPSGSVDSSIASAAQANSMSPATSRASSPPSSPGLDQSQPISAHLLAATSPDALPSGAMTPSSTRADAGESTLGLSAPITPIAGPTSELPPPEYDLVPGNLKLAARQLQRGLSANSTTAGHSFPASVTSSLASQYDPSTTSENVQMMQDVSGVSTPMGTPKAEHRDLEGSSRGEGSVVGDMDMEDLGSRLGGMEVDEKGMDLSGDLPTPLPKDEAAAELALPQDMEPVSTPHAQQDITDINLDSRQKDDSSAAKPSNQEQSHNVAATPPVHSHNDDDPNKADDLDALKRGELASPKPKSRSQPYNRNPINDMVEAAGTQNFAEHFIPPEQKKRQGGVAGQIMEDVWGPDSIEEPKSQDGQYDDTQMDVAEVTDSLGGDTPVPQGDEDSNVQGNSQAGEPAGEKKDENRSSMRGSAQWFEAEADADTKQGSSEVEQGGDRGQDGKVRYEVAPPSAYSQDDAVEHESVDKDADMSVQPPQSEKGAVPPPLPRSLVDDARARIGEEDQVPKEQVGDDEIKEKMVVEAQSEGHGKVQANTERAGMDESRSPAEQPTPTNHPKHLDSSDPHSAAELVTRSEEPIIGTTLTSQDSGSGKPLQVLIEPAPIAQPAPASEDTPSNDDHDAEKLTPPAETLTSPSFPTPPTADPESSTSSINGAPKRIPSSIDVNNTDHIQSAASTPIDPSFLRSFPDVPDEDKPRVEVHVQSPNSTPQKRRESNPNPLTPLANLPGHSKSLSNPNFLLDIQTQTQSLGEVGVGQDQSDETPRLSKRLSQRRSPKSPLLDDEDPGDFEPGEGWAVVTKYDSRRLN